MAGYKPKLCAQCGAEFTPTAPRSTYCTPECFKAKNRERMRKYRATNKGHAHKYYVANRERILESAKEYRQANREHLLAKRREYYQNNKERAAKYAATYRQNNKEKIAYYKRRHYRANKEHYADRARKYREANKEAVNERTRRWRASNPDKAGAPAARRAKAELEGNATRELIEAKWEAGDKTCILCGGPIDLTLKAPHPKSRTLEHLTPIARGGRHDLDNIDFAHFGCNASKRNKTLEEYREWVGQVA